MGTRPAPEWPAGSVAARVSGELEAAGTGGATGSAGRPPRTSPRANGTGSAYAASNSGAGGRGTGPRGADRDRYLILAPVA